ncbi:unnamed protein product [Rotaria sp. Silwood1]|nr:unnamed protein product [Rotaria sp. Silwood1]
MASINDSIVDEHCHLLVDYLNKVLRHPKFRAHPATCEFFDVSCLSFIHGLSVSRKEGYLLEKSNDYHCDHGAFFHSRYSCNLCKCHDGPKWFVIKDSYIVDIQPDIHEVCFPMLVDRGFQVLTGIHNTGHNNSIKIKNLQRTLVIKCSTALDCDEWTQHLSNLIEQAKDFVSALQSRFNSYAPVRENQLAYWFINGKSYMEAVAKALLTAKEEVFITDWWLSPEVMLIRPTDDETFRLDNILGRIAVKDAGVRVYVMLFKEMSFALGLNSLHTKKTLVSKSKKGFIKVIRHPKYNTKDGLLLWSHHEKTVVIDQKIAFVGGIDLCYGRWDDEHMRLVDLGDKNDTKLKSPFDIAAENVASGGRETVEAAQITTMQMAEQAGKTSIKWLSPEVMLIRPTDGETFRLDNILERIAVIRHPRYNTKDGLLLWSHLEKMVVIDQKIAFIGGIDLCYDRWDDEHMRFINGKSYMEAVVKALLIAKEEVFITDWWLSPEVMLIRPTDDETFRLDNILGRIADAGVRVYVMLFKEMSFVLALNSLYTKETLVSKSYSTSQIAFIGGIDLCYGRWDDEHMRLIDLGDKNDTKLKSSFDIVAENVASGGRETVEAAQITTMQMAEQAGEISVKSLNCLRAAFNPLNEATKNIGLSDSTDASGTAYDIKSIDENRN